MTILSKIDAQSAPAITSSVNFFHVPPTNVSNDEAFYREVLPLNPISQDSSAPSLFRLFSDALYPDFSRVYFYFLAWIEKQDDATGLHSKLIGEDANTKIGSVQYLGQTVIQQLRVHVGSQEVYDSGPLYAYKALIATELSQSLRMKETFLESAGYHPSLEHDNENDEGFKARCAQFAGGKAVQFYARLDFDIGNQEKYMLNNTDFLFSIYRARDAFVLQNLKKNDATRYRLHIEDVRLYVKMNRLQPNLDLTIYNGLKQQTAKYALRRVEVRNHFLTEGRTEFIHNIFTSQIPRRLTIALVANKAFNGDLSLSPFNFQHFNLTQISVHAGGKDYPYVPYSLDFPSGRAVRAYVDLWEALGAANGGTEFGPDLSLEQWNKGWTFLTIPMTSTLDDTCGFELIRNGTTSLRLKFDKEIPAGGVEMIVLGEFDQLFMMDENRRVVSDTQIN